MTALAVPGAWHHVVTMRRMGIREVRDNFTATIRAVRDGETVEVTHDGEPVAVIAPVRAGRADRLVAAGVAAPARRPLRRAAPLAATGPTTASEALAEDRAADR